MGQEETGLFWCNGTDVFYDDGNRATAGRADYALITDFNANEDVIQLKGQRSDYRLGSPPTGLPAGTAIYRDKPSGEPDELIGIVQGSPAPNLGSDDSGLTHPLNSTLLNSTAAMALCSTAQAIQLAQQAMSTAMALMTHRWELLVAPNGQYYAGESYVVFGSGEGFDASLDLAELDGSNGLLSKALTSLTAQAVQSAMREMSMAMALMT